MPENRDESLLADLLVRWEELHEQGQPVSAEELCRDCPHLAGELARRIEALKVTSWLDKPVEFTHVQAEPKPPTACHPRLLAGRYRLDELIAEGGFAQVWRGYDQELQRVVAVKVPKPGRLGSVEAFMAEARRVAKLKHPGIVPIFDTAGCAVPAGREGGSCFLVSEYVEGGSLADQMRRGPVPPADAARFVAEVAEALHYAHRQGFVHRDIKPANILIDHHGRALLTDFGIAVTTEEEAGSALGTLRYMSPEQVDGKPVDARSDLFSLGVVLHELLTGKVPYSSAEPNVLRREIVAGPTPAVSIPAGLRRICRKLLGRAPAARFASAGELAADLRQFLATGVRTGGRWWLTGGVAGLLLAGVGLAIWFNQPHSEGDRTAGPQAQSDEEWRRHIASLPAAEQVREIAASLKALNEGFDGELKETVEGAVVVGLEFVTDQVRDISPVRTLPGLRRLDCYGTHTGKSNGKLSDLSPLRGMRLTHLNCAANVRITDLSPLRDMPLVSLNCSRLGVSDLSPLQGMPLKKLLCGENPLHDLSALRGLRLVELWCNRTQVADLSPLEGMPLEQLRCQDTPVASLAPLGRMPLKGLECHRTDVADLNPLKGAPLEGLNVLSTKVADLSPLKQMPKLKWLWCDFVAERDAAILRSVTTLAVINDKSVAEFWREVDAKASK